MDEAAEKLEEATEAVFEDLEQQTGTTPSTSGCGVLKISFIKVTQSKRVNAGSDGIDEERCEGDGIRFFRAGKFRA